MSKQGSQKFSRRNFVKTMTGGMLASTFTPLSGWIKAAKSIKSDIFHVHRIPNSPFLSTGNGNHHIGLESLLQIMGEKGLKFYRSKHASALSGPDGLIEPQDVVLVKVNAQWKYRGCTNSDLIRGLVQRILDHPDGFAGEVVIFENGQSRGSLNCDMRLPYGETSVRANANNERHTFRYLIDHVFDDPRVSGYLLDPLIITFIDENDHKTDGYRKIDNISYPCFTSAGGNRIELKQGIWNGKKHASNLKLINVPVLKHHDTGGSEITGAVKHFYGVLSMHDGWRMPRHYDLLGETCGKMIASIRTPVLNIMDAIWVSHRSLWGYPERNTVRSNQIAASQDPVALDYWTAKHILYPVDRNPRHHPDFRGIQKWLDETQITINSRGGLRDPSQGIRVDQVTFDESRMRVHSVLSQARMISGTVTLGETSEVEAVGAGLPGVTLWGLPGDPVTDEEGRYRARVYSGWSGSIRPEKRGFIFAPGKRNLKNVTSKLKNQDFLAYKSIYAPLSLTGKQVQNRGLFFTEHIIKLSWEANPANSDNHIVNYRIYETSNESHTYLAEVNANTFQFMVRNSGNLGPRIFEVVAVSRQKREGAPASVTV
jgi:hypothetical protein